MDRSVATYMMARSPRIGAYSNGAILFKTHAPDPNLYVQTAGLHTVIVITISAVLLTLIMTFALRPVQILQSGIMLTTNCSIAASVFLSYTLTTAAGSYCQLWPMFLCYNWLSFVNHCNLESLQMQIQITVTLHPDELCFQDPGSTCKSRQDFSFEH